MKTFMELYDFHTMQFRNVLEGISDEDAMNRLNTKANHVAWLAGSLVQERFELGKAMGITDIRQTSDELFSDHKGIQDGVTYPSLDEYRKDWEVITPRLREAFASVSNEKLDGPDPFEMPGGPYTLYDAITFCTDRESYCIGQIGLWRRLLGYEPMKYG
ncbi:MAG: DinB family protein [Chitinophagaceae bacterium]|nr:MAG: DinB family protein [Chitinophagaceae bacterium]